MCVYQPNVMDILEASLDVEVDEPESPSDGEKTKKLKKSGTPKTPKKKGSVGEKKISVGEKKISVGEKKISVSDKKIRKKRGPPRPHRQVPDEVLSMRISKLLKRMEKAKTQLADATRHFDGYQNEQKYREADDEASE